MYSIVVTKEAQNCVCTQWLLRLNTGESCDRWHSGSHAKGACFNFWCALEAKVGPFQSMMCLLVAGNWPAFATNVPLHSRRKQAHPHSRNHQGHDMPPFNCPKLWTYADASELSHSYPIYILSLKATICLWLDVMASVLPHGNVWKKSHRTSRAQDSKHMGQYLYRLGCILHAIFSCDM